MIYFLFAVLCVAALVFYHALIFGFIAAVALTVWAAIAFVVVPPALFVWHHPWKTLIYVAAYFVTGAIWSVIHWYLDETARVRELKENTKEADWAATVARHKTNVRNYKTDFKVWVTFWPISLPYTFLHDPFRRLVRRIVAELQGVYQRITDYVWR